MLQHHQLYASILMLNVKQNLVQLESSPDLQTARQILLSNTPTHGRARYKPLGAVHKRRSHKIAKKPPSWLNRPAPSLSVRTHKFRKILIFLQFAPKSADVRI